MTFTEIMINFNSFILLDVIRAHLDESVAEFGSNLMLGAFIA